MKTKNIASVMLAACVLALAPTSAMAEGAHVAPVKEFVSENIEGWLTDPVVVSAIKEQNTKTASLDAAAIDKLDKQWRAQATATDQPFVSEVLARELSKFLMEKKDRSQGMITEMFVMDAKGLNVGQSDVTSDYWQGDEAKWQKTYAEGAGVVFVDEVEEDESTQALQSQASLTISDPETGEPIGAITVGINLDML
ncbi:hypothetical protein SAMN05877838_0459 [Hoeflea halophila]|uniref:Uncharacterized protein n=1 Tax=Hoeflea halophila TaxID=714899 RepID=A0A286HLP1_9HYPH|nr:hypothetical protein [Hoeflea halophila]SOE08730.1 hypothetical protein SAMN05877838_0459 [Hoeflea halophila]